MPKWGQSGEQENDKCEREGLYPPLYEKEREAWFLAVGLSLLRWWIRETKKTKNRSNVSTRDRMPRT